MPLTTVFLPGAGGRRAFWQPVADLLALGDDVVLLGWPGFGDEPPRSDVRTVSDLTPFVLDSINGEFNLVAQSMGGVVALQVALAAPERVKRVVLCGTSGGIDFGDIQREDWRRSYLQDMPAQTPPWFHEDRTDLTDRLGEIMAPALLIWGAADRIVPPPAGALLQRLLPDARLVVIPGAGHDGPETHPAEVASHVRLFLESPAQSPAPASPAPPSMPSLAPSPSRESARVRVSSANATTLEARCRIPHGGPRP